MPQTVSPFAKANILVIDDTPANLHLLANILSERGYCVRLAPNGALALKSIELIPPDLILLDIRMPGMDGYEVCTVLKAKENTRNLPIIFLSVLQDALEKVKAFSVGGADYVTKPFEAAEVIARIEHHLKLQRLQKQLLEQNEELARSNRELEQFASVVSHGLQQPLQRMIGFAKFILMSSEANLDNAAQESLNSVLDSGWQMQRLIQRLLAYAQASKWEKKLERVDCNVAIATALNNLQIDICEKQASVEVAPLPTVLGDETQLIQLFQNLIGNAIAFTQVDRVPQIKISVEQRTHEWCFSIRDNGIGIDPENSQRVFEAFKRLNSTRHYPESGMGLAICKKIVENHNGKIWVESQVGVGTAFYFTLGDASSIATREARTSRVFPESGLRPRKED